MASLDGIKHELSEAQLTIVKDEINNDPEGKGYAGQTDGGIVKLLNDKSKSDNPTPQEQIDGPPVLPEKILVDAPITLLEIKDAQADADGQIAWEMMMNLAEIDLNSALADECLTSLENTGILKPAKIQAIRDLGKIPDPDWQEQIEEQSRTEELLGDGYMIEGEDIKITQTLEVTKL